MMTEAQDQNQNSGDIFPENLQIDEKARQHLTAIATWCIVIVVTALIGYALNVAELLMSKGAAPIQTEGFTFKLDTRQSPGGVLIGLIIGLALNYFLFRFATQTQKAISGFDQDKLNNGFSNLKNYFIFLSVLMILFCLLMLLVIPALLK
jgi:small-conductance mechanosensitive channel